MMKTADKHLDATKKSCGNNGQFMLLRLFCIKYQSNKDKNLW